MVDGWAGTPELCIQAVKKSINQNMPPFPTRKGFQVHRWLGGGTQKVSVTIALLILAQISIACKELLISLKQAILIKAGIINQRSSDPRHPQNVEDSFCVAS